MGLFSDILAKYKTFVAQRKMKNEELRAQRAARKAAAERYFQGLEKYRKSLLDAVSDSAVSEEETRELEAITRDYNLQPQDINKAKQEAYATFFNRITSDNAISTEELDSLNALINYLNIPSSALGFDQEKFNDLRMAGYVSEKMLPSISSEGLNIILKKEEVIHYFCLAALIKRTKTTTKVGYSGITASIKIMKGVRYRIGTVKPIVHVTESLAKEDVGFIWISNQRIGFKGEKKNISFPIDKLASFEIKDGLLQLGKDGRENPFIFYLAKLDLFCGTLSVVLEGDYKIDTKTLKNAG